MEQIAQRFFNELTARRASLVALWLAQTLEIAVRRTANLVPPCKPTLSLMFDIIVEFWLDKHVDMSLRDEILYMFDSRARVYYLRLTDHPVVSPDAAAALMQTYGSLWSNSAMEAGSRVRLSKFQLNTMCNRNDIAHALIDGLFAMVNARERSAVRLKKCWAEMRVAAVARLAVVADTWVTAYAVKVLDDGNTLVRLVASVNAPWVAVSAVRRSGDGTTLARIAVTANGSWVVASAVKRLDHGIRLADSAKPAARAGAGACPSSDSSSDATRKRLKPSPPKSTA